MASTKKGNSVASCQIGGKTLYFDTLDNAAKAATSGQITILTNDALTLSKHIAEGVTLEIGSGQAVKVDLAAMTSSLANMKGTISVQAGGKLNAKTGTPDTDVINMIGDESYNIQLTSGKIDVSLANLATSSTIVIDFVGAKAEVPASGYWTLAMTSASAKMDVTLDADSELSVSGQLRIANGSTLTNNGKLTVNSGGLLRVSSQGKIEGSGAITNSGTVTLHKGDGTDTATVAPTITLAPGGSVYSQFALEDGKVGPDGQVSHSTGSFTVVGVTDDNGQLLNFTDCYTYGIVTVKPMDMTAYVGGTGYSGAVDGSGAAISGESNGIPTPRFYIDVREGIEPTELTFTNGSDRSWTVAEAGTDENDDKVYTLNAGEGQAPVRMQYKSGKTVYVGDQVLDGASADYTASIYPGGVNISDVKAKYQKEDHEYTLSVAVENGTLTLRNLTENADTTAVAGTAPTTGTNLGSGLAVADGVTYTINDTGVTAAAATPKLLVDDIISDDAKTALQNAVDAELDSTSGNRQYAIKYLDLVDSSDGNLQLTPSGDITVYLPYPEGADQNTKFTLLHFVGVHRGDSNLNDVTPTEVNLTKTDDWLSFTTSSFSPFALVWDVNNGGSSTSGGGGGGSTPTYASTVESSANGTVSVSPKNAAKNATVTITVTPDEGYELASLTVTDKDGKAVELTKVSDTQYTFKMPGSAVTVKASFAKGSLPFTDVNGHWALDAIEYVYENGMMSGITTTEFGPETQLTRGMIVTILYRMEKEPSVSGSSFTDVNPSQYYADPIAWAAKNEIVAGYGDGTFGPNDSITREQLAAILYRYASFKGYDVSVGEDTNILSYLDAADISDYAIPAFQWACGSGVIYGVTESTLVPGGTATRAQVAAMLMRFCENVAK